MKQNSTADISFEVGYKDDKTRFDLKLISVSDETEINQRFSDIADSDTDKTGKETAICLDALVTFSQHPEDGEKIRQKLSDVNIKSERIIRTAYQQFKLALSPEVNFQ